MSAWYVLNSTGIYQVAPGNNEFVTSECLFDSAKYHLSSGHTFKTYDASLQDKKLQELMSSVLIHLVLLGQLLLKLLF